MSYRHAALALSVVSVSVLAGPPETERRPVTDVVHGHSMTDDFRWLEGDNSDPEAMGARTAEVDAWTDAQNDYTRSVLDGVAPGYEFLREPRRRLEDRMRDLMEVGQVGTPRMAGTRYFYTKREGAEAQPAIYVRETVDGPGRKLIDPNTLDESGLLNVSWFVPSRDGRLLAFGTYEAGDENSVLQILDVDSGEWLPDRIEGKVWMSGWLPNGSGFFYRRLEDLQDPYSGMVMFHRLGTPVDKDITLVRQRDLSSLYRGDEYTDEQFESIKTTYGPAASLDRDGEWMTVGYYTGTRSNDLWAVNVTDWAESGSLELREILGGSLESNASGWGQVVGDTLFMQTTLDAPNGRIVAVDLNEPGSETSWKSIVPERSDGVIQGFSIAAGQMAVTYLKDASSRIELFDLEGSKKGVLELPGIGSASLSTTPDRSEAFLSFSSYNEPRSVYRIDLDSGERELWARPDVPVDPDSIEVRQVTYQSKDGTDVTMFLVHKRGLEMDGSNPTILYGYGGFNISMTPRFSATLFPFFEAGGVYAIANLRGGGEYGKAWHEGGRLDRKQNVFDDFIAAGEYLIESGVTSADRLGIAGGSNGGLLTGAAITQRPDLFGAAISAVPLLDMIRYHRFLMARYWVPEYGSSDSEEQFEYLLDYSPYHNIRPGTEYPAVLITAGENDSRVHPLHARKMAAALQAASGSDAADDPVLLWVDRDGGHGAGKPLELRLRDVVDQRLFMMWQLGMLDG